MRILRKGQSTLEYLIMVVAAVIVFLAFLNHRSQNNFFQSKVESSLELGVELIDKARANIVFMNSN